MPRPSFVKSTEGGVVIAAVITVAILASIASMTLFGVTTRHRNAYQAATWRDSLIAAEAGAERAMAELVADVKDPANAWNGWTVVDASGTPVSPQTIDRDGYWAPGYAIRATATLPAQAGETAQTQYSVVIDVPSSLAPTTKRWNQAYRIRSTGVASLNRAANSVTDKRDSQLRRLSMVWDRTVGFATSGTKLTTPQATRTIEIVAKPETVYKDAMIAEIYFKLKKNTFIDGYNSIDPNFSINGKYDPSKRTLNGGTIVANRWKKKPKPENATEKFDVGKATIYGDLKIKGSLKNVKNYDNVQGKKLTNYSVDTGTNLRPVWTSVTANIDKLDGKIPDALKATYKIAEKNAKAGGPAAQLEAKSATAAAELAAKGMELVGGASRSSPARFIVNTVDVNKKDESLVFSNPPGVTESWVEVLVNEDFKISGGGSMYIANGVHVTLYLDGKKAEIKDTKKDSGGFFLESGFPPDLQIIGIEAAEDVKKETDDEYSPKKRSGKIKIEDADFVGVINAPDWDIDFKPKDGDKDDTIHGAQLYGSILGRKVKIDHGADFHYDEAIALTGRPVGYSVASWTELER